MCQWTALLVVVLLIAAVPGATAGEVMESSYAMPDGNRVLRHDVLVAATPEAVWEMLMKEPPGEVLSFVPNEMLSVRNEDGVFTVIQLLRINDPGTTRIRMSTLPIGDVEKLYERLRRENAATLQSIEQRLAK